MMKINVVGIGPRMTGTSKKTGRDYDFFTLYVQEDVPRGDGIRTQEISVDGKFYNACEYPAEYEVEYDHRGRVVDIALI